MLLLVFGVLLGVMCGVLFDDFVFGVVECVVICDDLVCV